MPLPEDPRVSLSNQIHAYSQAALLSFNSCCIVNEAYSLLYLEDMVEFNATELWVCALSSLLRPDRTRLLTRRCRFIVHVGIQVLMHYTFYSVLLHCYFHFYCLIRLHKISLLSIYWRGHAVCKDTVNSKQNLVIIRDLSL